MALTWQTPSVATYSSQNGNSLSVNYPVGCAESDKLILVIGMKPSTANSGSVTTPAGWTPVCSLVGVGGYGTTLGADTGNTNLFVFERTVSAGGLSGSLSVSVAGNNVSWGMICRITKTRSGWEVAGTTGQDTSAGNVSIAFGSDPGVASGDLIIGAMCIPTDVSTPSQFSAEAFSQTGVTFGTVAEVEEPDSQTGNDIGGFVCYAMVSSGTSSGPPTLAATAGGTTTNVRGPGVFIRVRETTTIHTASLSEPGTGSESSSDSAGFVLAFSETTFSSPETSTAGLALTASGTDASTSTSNPAVFATGQINLGEQDFVSAESSTLQKETSFTSEETGFSSSTFEGANHGQTANHQDQTSSGENETALTVVFIAFGETDIAPDDRQSGQTSILEQTGEAAVPGDEQHSLAGFGLDFSEPGLQFADFQEAAAQPGSQTFVTSLAENHSLWEDPAACLLVPVSFAESGALCADDLSQFLFQTAWMPESAETGISLEVNTCFLELALESYLTEDQNQAKTALMSAVIDEVLGYEASAGANWIPIMEPLLSEDSTDSTSILRLASIPEWLICQLEAPLCVKPVISVELTL